MLGLKDLETLNEFGKKTYLIETRGGLGFYAREVAWSDTLVTIMELDSRFYPDSTAAVFDSLPITLPVEEIESIGRVTTDLEESTLILVLIVVGAGVLAYLGYWFVENLRFGT